MPDDTIKNVLIKTFAQNQIPIGMAIYCLALIELAAGDYNRRVSENFDEFPEAMRQAARDAYGVNVDVHTADKCETTAGDPKLN